MTAHRQTMRVFFFVGLGTAGIVGLASCSKPAASGPSTQTPTSTEDVSQDAQEPAASSKVEVCMGELVPAEDGLIDDFEDGDNRVAPAGGRDGTWWLARDSKGSAFTTPVGAFATADGGADSPKAIHVSGQTVTGSNDAWGVEFGANYRNAKGGLYDASKYAGVRFKAKAAGGPTDLRVNLGDVNTHADAGKCTQCWNHFRKDFVLGEEWQTYTMRYSDLAQRDGWGDPRPKSLSPKELVTISFAIDGGGSFDVWIDDIEFLVCDD